MELASLVQLLFPSVTSCVAFRKLFLFIPATVRTSETQKKERQHLPPRVVRLGWYDTCPVSRQILSGRCYYVGVQDIRISPSEHCWDIPWVFTRWGHRNWWRSAHIFKGLRAAAQWGRVQIYHVNKCPHSLHSFPLISAYTYGGF